MRKTSGGSGRVMQPILRWATAVVNQIWLSESLPNPRIEKQYSWYPLAKKEQAPGIVQGLL
ncbi:MAG: hypothetical protein BZY87_00240 [SAR202 cluster bacterium Io17-Chloro-G6]|nr:MAG: hypothetical protein BZY87_00240 [SAR202 cluster bacterium Io17-Chloro-G6]